MLNTTPQKQELSETEIKLIRKLRGKKSRTTGTKFEQKVRQKLEKDSWIVDKWKNNVDLEKKKLIPAKPKFNPFTKSLMMNSSGFCDFIIFKRITHKELLEVMKDE